MRQKTGKSGVMVVKVDLEKAYDRIIGVFLERTLVAMGFDLNLTKLIMSGVISTKLSMLWNGEMLEPFVPQRGLQQGDPLSPYCFVICMEVLGKLIGAIVDIGCWKTIKLSRSRSNISHIFFANDLVLFREALSKQAKTMAYIMDVFATLVAKK